ncbi:hypothetical protein Tco_0418242 [Tanacetum coccineum]
MVQVSPPKMPIRSSLESLSLMLKALLDPLLVHRMSPLFLLKALAVLMIGPQLDHEDLEQLDEFDLEEMDLKWQIAMISMRLKKFYKKTGRRLQFDAKEPIGFDKTKGTLDIEQKIMGGDLENRRNLKLCNLGSDIEVKFCSKECVKSYAKLKKLFDEQREQLGDASIEIQAYTQALKEMSTRDKFGLGSSDVENSSLHDRFANVEGMHAIPPPMTGNYMPSGPDKEPDAPIIEEYELDSDDEYVIQPLKEQERPSFASIDTVKHAKTPRETIKEQNTYSLSPKSNKREWNGLISKRLGLGYGFTKKACFVYGSFSHLIKDCDFHEKRMAKQVELNKKKGKGTGQGENRPVWNNVQRLNHQNKFVPTAVLTRTGKILVNIASHNFNSQAVSTSVARKVNAARPIVNENRPRNNFYKSHSPIKRPVNRTTAPRTKFSN